MRLATTESDLKSFKRFKKLRDFCAERILKGREHNGEPADFNF